MVRVAELCSQTHDTLSGLILDHFIHRVKQAEPQPPVKKFKKHTPVSSDGSSSPSFDEEKISLLINIQETPEGPQGCEVPSELPVIS
jgi:hypothetical protein